MGVDYFSSNSWSGRQFTETMQKNLSVVAGQQSRRWPKPLEVATISLHHRPEPVFGKMGCGPVGCLLHHLPIRQQLGRHDTLTPSAWKYHHQRTETAAPGASGQFGESE